MKYLNVIFKLLIILQLLMIQSIIIVNGDIYTNDMLKEDYDCLNSLLGTLQITGTSSFIDNPQYCNRSSLDQKVLLVDCSQDKSIYLLTIYADKSKTIEIGYDDLSCFRSVNQLLINGFTLKNNAFGNENGIDTSRNRPVAYSIFVVDCNFIDGTITSSSIPIGTGLFRITLSASLSNLQFLKFSVFKNINQSFILEPSLSNVEVIGLIYPVLNNDLTASEACTIRNLEFVSSNIPSMNYVNAQFLTLKIITDSDTLQYSNFTTYTGIGSLSLTNKKPTNLSYFLTQPTVKNLIINTQISTPISKMDFSNTIFESLYFGSKSQNFHINNELPISVLPPNIKEFAVASTDITKFNVSLFSNSPNISSIILSNNNIQGTLPDISSLPNLHTLGLANNNFVGSIPESYCSVQNLNLEENNLSGDLNTCFSCYIIENPDMIPYLNNTNLDISYNCPIGSIVPNLKIVETSTQVYKLTIFGKGLYFYNPSKNAGLEFTVIKGSELFEGFWDENQLGSIPHFLEFSFGGKTFEFSTIDIAPRVTKYIRSDSTFIFSGMYFTYNISNFQINIGGINCPIISTVYENITCKIGDDDWVNDVPVGVSIKTIITNKLNNLFHQITIDSTGAGNNVETDVKECFSPCQNGGYCSTKSTLCVCSPDWSGVDCSFRVYQCPNNCSLNGICISTDGTCDCNVGWQSDDCSIPFKTCSNDCSSLGSCNNQTGTCNCYPDYTTADCSKPNQFISSIEPTTTAGGLVKINGWFGTVNDGLSITIGSLDCVLVNVTSSYIFCLVGGDSGTKSVIIIQNGISYTSENKYHYEETSYKCSNNCSNHGDCNTKVGQCKCYSGWGGFDCNSIKTIPTTTTTSSTTTTTTGSTNTPTPTTTPEPVIIPPTETNINTTSGSAIINNQKTTYEILITSLVEIGFNNEIIKETALQNKWVSDTSITNKYLFSQILNDTSCLITYSIEELKESRDYTFADLDLTLDKDSIKITVEIRDYPYTSALNTLQLQFQSKIGTTETKDDGGECNHAETSIDTKQIDKNQLLNYITISKDSKTLYGRFVNRVISDTKPTFITASIVPNNRSSSDTLTIGVNLPHCKSCLIDPDFSVLVSNSFKKCVDGKLVDESGRASWVLPVAIVVPCVAVAAIIIIGAIVYSKNRTSIKLTKEKYSFKLKGLSKKNKDELYMPNKQ